MSLLWENLSQNRLFNMKLEKEKTILKDKTFV